jgi:disulfide bond formation protein DsbB
MALARDLALAQRIALAIPLLLLGGAYLSQYGFGLYPCEMCWWQRYAHFAAAGLAMISFLAPPRRGWVLLAGLAIVVAGLLGGFHAGVEYGWWEGLTRCATADLGGGDPLSAIMNAPMIRCDEVQWSLFGISLAGWNFLISTSAGLAVLFLAGRNR